MKSISFSLCLGLVFLYLSALLPLPTLAGADWKAVDPAELALKESVVEKDADAEALFWKVRIATVLW